MKCQIKIEVDLQNKQSHLYYVNCHFSMPKPDLKTFGTEYMLLSISQVFSNSALFLLFWQLPFSEKFRRLRHSLVMVLKTTSPNIQAT